MGKCQLCDSHINGRLQNMMKCEEVYLKTSSILRQLGVYVRFCYGPALVGT